ncbi:hypothetical protein BSKO_04591 [Bryopsis sp. KO-2023]|nr:hypothetical protein BSKO_04591 [Bryopsis sp. KO-2023]
MAIARLANLAQFGGMGLILAGERILPMLGLNETPQILQNAMSNKMGSCMLLYFIGGTISQNLMKTGAFEVYYDGHQIFSKMETNRMPTREEILKSMDRYLAQAHKQIPEPSES